MVEPGGDRGDGTESRDASRPPVAELVSVQYLRATAALGVVVWHAQGQMGLKETTVLQAGIEIFFIISGYVMWLILARRPVSPAAFLRKRLIRVVPLYWVLTSLMVALLLVAPQLLQSARFDPAHIVASYLFVAWPNPAEGAGLKPVMIPGWTLNYEMFFYLVLACALPFGLRLRGLIILGILGFLGAASLLPLPPIAHFYASPFMLEFALGILLALGLERLPERWKRHGPAAFIAGTALLFVGGLLIDPQNHARLIAFGLPVTLLIGGLVCWETAGRLPSLPWLKRIGDASYPLYMIHPVLLSAMAQGWRAAGLTALSPWLFVAAGVVVTSVAGWVLHVVLERPLMAAFGPARKAPRLAPAALPLAPAPVDR
jgi:exopolysaccharide production protein ExoZ